MDCLVCKYANLTWEEIYSIIGYDMPDMYLCKDHLQKYEFQLIDACNESDRKCSISSDA